MVIIPPVTVQAVDYRFAISYDSDNMNRLYIRVQGTDDSEYRFTIDGVNLLTQSALIELAHSKFAECLQ